MTLLALPRLWRDLPAAGDLVGNHGAVLSVADSARPFVVAGLATSSSRHPIVVACPSQTDAERLAHDVAAFLGPDAVDTFPAWETLPFERVSPSVETMGRRLRAMWRLQQADGAPRVLVATVRALVQRLGPHVEEAAPVVVRAGDQLDPEKLVERLVASGYRREYQVEHRGELAVRGSIVDVFPSTAAGPVRIDLWGDEVDRLTEFSVADQRSTADIGEVDLFGCRELLPTPEVQARAQSLMATAPWGRQHWEKLAHGLSFDGMESWLPWLTSGEHLLSDLLPATAQVLLLEPRRMRDRAGDILDEEASLAGTLAVTWGADAHAGFPRLHLPFDRLLAHTTAPAWTVTSVPPPVGAAADRSTGPAVTVIEASGWDAGANGEASALVKRVDGLLADGYRVTVACDGTGSAARIAQSLADSGVTAPLAKADAEELTRPGIRVVVQPLDRGFVLPGARLAVVAEADLSGRRRAHRQARPRPRPTEGFFDSLQPGHHVVHHHHGVGRYQGLVRRALMGGPERDYLLIQYRDGTLNLPSDQIDLIRPYTGGESPSLNRMGGSDWNRTKAKVRSAVREIAQELVVLYQKRQVSPGHAFAPDTPWQRELEDSFPYIETPDQTKAVTDVKQDMEQPRPMDRLVCGDVGFGKTEVALRAVFKCVQDGKQAAVLVPTTLLAQQHFQTFSDRYAGFPVRVEVLSRFLTAAQARKVMHDLATGQVDVVIGTHRLLTGDVHFKDLGLLVVDEEQRFGVTHKEQIKQLRANVDVLTLTATPIPRTLEMSLTGIRDLTLLNTPPAERQPILTYVGDYDEHAVAEAIRRELLREGQVFFVHNRVMDIDQTASRIRDLVPEARVAVAHGQMDEGSLEKVVYDFWQGQHDVLVCTTIIESGIDMPTVNTMVVDRADLLGLGQLHQLRGRVGRAGQRAYAYLFTPPDRSLTEEAYERLKTIGEHTELGSGFKIAMRDLEIRGAGNLLGGDQSGHIAAVGYDLYVQLVSEAVAELKGELPREPAEIKLEVPVDANLPTSYVERDDLRLEAYRRLAAVTTQDEVDDIRAEWADRFGPLPPPAEGLIAVGRLRAECARTGVKELVVAKGRGDSGFGQPPQARISPLELLTSQRLRLHRLYPKAVYKEADGLVVVPVPAKGVAAVEWLGQVISTLVPPEPASAAS